MDELRRRFDNRNTARYYASGNPSALGEQSAADSTSKPGEAPRPIVPDPARELRTRMDERSTDRYYREQTVKAPTKQQIAAQLTSVLSRAPRRASLELSGYSPAVVSTTAGILVPNQQAVRAAVARAIESVKAGERPVLAVTGEAVLGMAVRSAVDMAITRELITEEQGRDIVIDLSRTGTAGQVVQETRTPDEMFGDPEAALASKRDAGENASDEDAFLGDPGAFLRGETDDEMETMPEAPAPTVAEDDDNDFLAGEPEKATTFDPAVDLDRTAKLEDNTSDFLAETAPGDTGLFNEDEVADDATVPAATPVASPAAPAQAPKKKGKRN